MVLGLEDLAHQADRFVHDAEEVRVLVAGQWSDQRLQHPWVDVAWAGGHEDALGREAEGVGVGAFFGMRLEGRGHGSWQGWLHKSRLACPRLLTQLRCASVPTASLRSLRSIREGDFLEPR